MLQGCPPDPGPPAWSPSLESSQQSVDEEPGFTESREPDARTAAFVSNHELNDESGAAKHGKPYLPGSALLLELTPNEPMVRYEKVKARDGVSTFHLQAGMVNVLGSEQYERSERQLLSLAGQPPTSCI